MRVAKAVDFFEKAAQRHRIAVRQDGVFEDVAEQIGQIRVVAHRGEGFAVQQQHFRAAHGRMQQARPGEFRVVAGEK